MGASSEGFLEKEALLDLVAERRLPDLGSAR